MAGNVRSSARKGKLLRIHVVGPDGRCRGCHSQMGRGEEWPCTLYRAAARARRIAQE
jgi:hypothetical protein